MWRIAGYTNSAKVNAVKSNHTSVVKYITAELQKCNLDYTTVINNKLICTNRTTAHAVSTAAEQGLTDFKNPYKIGINAVSQGSLGFNFTKYTAGETKIDNTTSEVEDLIYLKDKNLLLINGGIGFVVDSGTQPAQELIVN